MAAVGIFGYPRDPQVVRASKAIEAQGGRPLVVDLRAFPGALRMTVSDEQVHVGDAEDVTGWYVRSVPRQALFSPGPGDPRDEEARLRRLVAAERERQGFVRGVLAELAARGATVVNPVECLEQHGSKLEQLTRLRSAGLRVPRGTATNDPEQVRAFREATGRAVYKPLAGGALVRELTDADLSEERLAKLARAPVLFQELVPGVDVRAFVCDGRVVAAFAIDTDALDYRGQEKGVTETPLDEEEETMALAASTALGMRFAGVDVKRGPDGPVLLDVNPSPMFAGFENRTGARAVSAALAELLLRPPPQAGQE
jgi:glutathione synthase/RimK-type ligase-like ATP-grasp enzyme